MLDAKRWSLESSRTGEVCEGCLGLQWIAAGVAGHYVYSSTVWAHVDMLPPFPTTSFSCPPLIPPIGIIPVTVPELAFYPYHWVPSSAYCQLPFSLSRL